VALARCFFARLNWFCPAIWLLDYGVSVRLPGCSGKVVLFLNLAARWGCFCQLLWLLGLSGSFRFAGCSYGVVLSQLGCYFQMFRSFLVAAPWLWFFPAFWLIYLCGSFVGRGCSLQLVLSYLLAARCNWFCPTCWLLTHFGSDLEVWLLRHSGSLIAIGCSLQLVLSRDWAAFVFWFPSRGLAALPFWFNDFGSSLGAMTTPNQWFVQRLWVLRERVSISNLGCSLHVVPSRLVAARWYWFVRLGWLLVACGSIAVSGCSVWLVLSTEMAGSRYTFSLVRSPFEEIPGAWGTNRDLDVVGLPVLHLAVVASHTGFANPFGSLGVSVAFVYLRAAFVARSLLPAFFGFHFLLLRGFASNVWFALSTWLLIGNGSFYRTGCSSLLVRSTLTAARGEWFYQPTWLLSIDGSFYSSGCSR